MYTDCDGQGSAKRRKIEQSPPSNGVAVASGQSEPTESEAKFSARIQETALPTQNESLDAPGNEEEKSCPQPVRSTGGQETGAAEGQGGPPAQVENRLPEIDDHAYNGQQFVGSKRKLEDPPMTNFGETHDAEKGPVSASYSVSDLPVSGTMGTVSEMGNGHMEIEPDTLDVGEGAGPESRTIAASGPDKEATVSIEQVDGERSRAQEPLSGLRLIPPADVEGHPAPEKQSSNGALDSILLPPDSEKPSSATGIKEKLDAEFVRAGEANEGNGNAEWQLDSSDAASSSSSDDTSSDSDSSSDSEDVDDYELLNPEEQARILMQGEGGSDDEGAGKGGKAGGGQLRTKNEKPDEKVHKPKINVTSEMKIEELGAVESLVESLVVIGAKTSGEYKVLETGSILCLENRSVIGVVAETLGRVHQPLYSVRFTNAAEIADAGIEKGTRVYYVEEHSTFVFTEPLKAIKGSDASNLHDEEVAEDEMEFSDDEAEAEHKRRVKQERQAKKDSRMGGSTAPNQAKGKARPRQEHSNYNPNPEMNYDDADDLYTPLARPHNLHEIRDPGLGPYHSRDMRRNLSDVPVGTFVGLPPGGRGSVRGAHRGHDSRGGRSNRGDRRGGGRGHQSDRRGDDSFRSDTVRDMWGHGEAGSHDSSHGAFSAYGPPSYNQGQRQWVGDQNTRPRTAQSQDYDQSSMPPPSSNPSALHASQAGGSPILMGSFHLASNYPHPQQYPPLPSQHRAPRESFDLPQSYPQMQQYSPPARQPPSRRDSFHLPAHFNPAEPYSHFFPPKQQQPDFHASEMPPPKPFYNEGPPSAGGNFPAGAYVNPAFFPGQQQQPPMHPQWTQAPPHPSQYHHYPSIREPPPANWGPGPPFQQPPPQTPWSSQQHSPTNPAVHGRPDHGAANWLPTPDESVFMHGQWSPPEQRTPYTQASRAWQGVSSPDADAAFEDVQKQLNIIKSLDPGAQTFKPDQQG